MKQNMVDFYNKSRQKFLNGEINEAEWNFICLNMLEIIINEYEKEGKNNE